MFQRLGLVGRIKRIDGRKKARKEEGRGGKEEGRKKERGREGEKKEVRKEGGSKEGRKKGRKDVSTKPFAQPSVRFSQSQRVKRTTIKAYSSFWSKLS